MARHFNFDWRAEGNTFRAPAPGGTAVIVVIERRGYGVPIGGCYRYDARVEREDGTAVIAVPDWGDFVEAEDFLRVALPWLRQKKQRNSTS